MKKTLQLFIMLATVSILQAQTAKNSCATAENDTHITASGTFSVGDIDGNTIPIVCSGGSSMPSNPHAEWFAYTPAANLLVTVSSDLAINGDKDTRLHIYTGTCGSITCVVGDDDGGVYEGTNGSSWLSVASFTAYVGQTYYIAWDNRYTGGDNFTFEVTEESVPPISFSAQSIGTTGTRRGAVDMNGDFLDDIVSIVTGNVDGSLATTGINILHQQGDGSFIATTYPLSTPYTSGWSLAAGDFDGNGYNDLVFGDTSGVTVVKANSNGTAYSVANENNNVFTQRTNFVDINNDGDLDIFVCHDQAPNVYYINDGTGNLDFYQGADPNGVPEGLGLFSNGGNYGSIWIDYDNDHDMDLFIAKCGGSVERRSNQLFRNNGNGSFTMMTPNFEDGNPNNDTDPTGLSDAMQTWSSAWADYDNDGDMDVFVGSSSGSEDHKMMRNNGDGTFTDITASTDLLSFSQKGIENVAHDFNNDGYVDIFSNGKMLLNDGDFTFTEYADGIPATRAIGDLNNDGFLDVFANQVHYNTTDNGFNWLKINTIGNQSNINGIGARVEIVSALGTQIRDVRSADGFRYMSSLNTHFGLGDDTSITSVTVFWPSGVVDIITNPAINSTLTINEGDTLGIENSIVTNLILYPNPTKSILNVNSNLNLQNGIFSVFDITGKRVLNAKLESNQIDVTNLNAGNYILRIISNGEIISQKFIKQ
jgi:hypothetical protein